MTVTPFQVPGPPRVPRQVPSRGRRLALDPRAADHGPDPVPVRRQLHLGILAHQPQQGQLKGLEEAHGVRPAASRQGGLHHGKVSAAGVCLQVSGFDESFANSKEVGATSFHIVSFHADEWLMRFFFRYTGVGQR